MNVPPPSARPPAAFPTTYDAGLVEESVLLAERRLPPAEAAAFRAERDRIYEVDVPDEREDRFEELHGRLFLRLGLDRPLHEALAEREALLVCSRGCRVLRAASPSEEAADVRRELDAPPEATPTIVIHLRPRSLLEPHALRTLLRRELLHVADMLDPAFGYVREPFRVDPDPAASNLVRDRYRVVWDASVDGRLWREGFLGPRARADRRRDFTRAFRILEDRTEAAFAEWFDGPRPTHAAILAFARAQRQRESPTG